MQTADLMPVYPEIADPVEKIPELTEVPISYSSHGEPASHRRKFTGNSSVVPGKLGCDEWVFWLPWDLTGYFVGNWISWYIRGCANEH